MLTRLAATRRRTVSRRAFALLAPLALLLPGATGAQTVGERSGERPPVNGVSGTPSATVAGRVFDERSGLPVRGALVAARQPLGGRYPTDASGYFLLRRVQPGSVTLDVNCPSRVQLGPHMLDTVVTVPADDTLTLILWTDASGLCIEPDSGTRRVVLRGTYTAGFEWTEFVPCADSGRAFAAMWGPPHLRWAIVHFPRNDYRTIPARWTAGQQVRYGTRWYVEWSGTLKGPGAFGIAPYLFQVETISAIHDRVPAECRPLTREPQWR